ncbi:calcium-binding protein, partial [Micromonospora sp. BL4]
PGHPGNPGPGGDDPNSGDDDNCGPKRELCPDPAGGKDG